MSIKRKLNSAFDNVDDQQSYTSQLKYHKFKLYWTIENFEFSCKHMKFIESPRFPPDNSELLKWYLRFEPVELKEGNLEKFKIILKNTASITKHIKVVISICNSSRQEPSDVSHFQDYSSDVTWMKSGSYLYRALLYNNSLSKDVTVICELDVFESLEDVVKKPITNFLKYEGLLGQIDNFYHDEAFKDVNFTIEEKIFSAHRLILALRSPVFATMFKNKIIEELTSVVEISDIKPIIFQKMLRFIYTDKIDNLEESAIELFHAAEKYQLEKLKKLCINSLYESLSVDTIVETLELADKFSISKLKKKCLEYLVSHLQIVKETHEFEELLKIRPHLSQEICKVQETINYKNDADVLYSKKTTCQLRLSR